MRHFKIPMNTEEKALPLTQESRWNEFDFGDEHPSMETLELICPPRDELLSRVCEKIAFLVNFDLSAFKHDLLNRKFLDFLEARFPPSVDQTDDNIVKWLSESPRRIYSFIDKLLINETAVFRADSSHVLPTASWEMLLNKIIPLLKEDGDIRTWVIGASDLSESTSIGLLFELTECKYNIIATDCDTEVLGSAKSNLSRGLKFLFNGKIPIFIKDKYKKIPEDVFLNIADRITLMRHEVLKDPMIGVSFNFVSMSHLLRHYNEWGQKACLVAVDRCVAPGGILFVGEYEADAVEDILPHYKKIGKRFYQKKKGSS